MYIYISHNITFLIIIMHFFQRVEEEDHVEYAPITMRWWSNFSLFQSTRPKRQETLLWSHLFTSAHKCGLICWTDSLCMRMFLLLDVCLMSVCELIEVWKVRRWEKRAGLFPFLLARNHFTSFFTKLTSTLSTKYKLYTLWKH